MKFWDSSALVPLVVAESSSSSLQTLAERDSPMFVWWGTDVECVSALARHERAGSLDSLSAELARGKLKDLARHWDEIEPSETIRETAKRFLRVHPLRAADALQLAAAFVVANGRPASLEFVTLDERLAEAARKEGFAVVSVQ